MRWDNNSACSDATATSLSVVVVAQAEAPTVCTANLLVGSTGISTTGSANSTTTAATFPAPSNSTIIILATVIPGAVLLAVGIGVLVYCLRKRELASRHAQFSAKQKAKLTD